MLSLCLISVPHWNRDSNLPICSFPFSITCQWYPAMWTLNRKGTRQISESPSILHNCWINLPQSSLLYLLIDLEERKPSHYFPQALLPTDKLSHYTGTTQSVVSNDKYPQVKTLATLWNWVHSVQQANMVLATRTFSSIWCFQTQLFLISQRREIPEGEDVTNALKIVNIFVSSRDWNG